MNSNLNQLEEAARFHRSGNLQQAEEIYRAILHDSPQNDNALHLLGVVHHQRGENAAATEFIRQAIAIVPEAAEYRTNLGSVLLALGKMEEAIDAYREALKYAEDDSDIHFNLGNLYVATHRHHEAIDSYQHAVRISPSRGDVWNSLGRIYQQLKRWEEAADSFQRAMQLSPGDYGPVNNLGVVHEKLGNDKTAFEFFAQASLLCPDSADVHYNAGNLARRLYRYEEACHYYRQAMSHRERFAEASVNLAVAYSAMGEFHTALDVNDRFLEEFPDHAETRFNNSLIRLRLKDFTTGWDEYEWRWKHGGHARRLSSPEWDGSDLACKSILVTAEQGVGDHLMFASCLEELAKKAESVSVECDPRLVPIFKRSFPTIAVVPSRLENANQENAKQEYEESQEHRPAVDYEIPIGSLPRFFRSSQSDFPSHERFLFPDRRRHDHWIDRLAELNGNFKVGISWHGGKDEETQTMRSISLDQWHRLANLENVSLINLQYGDSHFEREEFFDRTGSRIHYFEEIDPLNELDEFAALISALDLVISIDNSTVHFAGALGTPCSVLLPHYADWRWFTDPEESLWYRSLRVFRQQSKTGWDTVIDEVIEHLVLKQRTIPQDLAG